MAKVGQAKREPDKGSASDYAMCCISFCTLFLCSFPASCYGIVMLEMQNHFENQTAELSLAGSVNIGCSMFMGPIVSILLDRWSCRCVIIGGTLVAVVGFVISSFSTSVEMLILTYGAISGSAIGVVYITVIVMVGLRFTRRRALATGIAMSGSGAGVLAMSYPIERLLVEYGWRGTVLIEAGMILNCCVFGALVFPPRRALKPSSSQEQSPDSETSLNLTNKDGPHEGLSEQSLPSNGLLQESRPKVGVIRKDTCTNSEDFIMPCHTSEGLLKNEFSEVPVKNGDPSAGTTKQGELSDSIYSGSGYLENKSEMKCLMLQDKNAHSLCSDDKISPKEIIIQKAVPITLMNPLLNRSLPIVHQRRTPPVASDKSRDHQSVKYVTSNGHADHLWCSEPLLFLRPFPSHPKIEIEINEEEDSSEARDRCSSMKSWLKRHTDLGQNSSFLMIVLFMSLYTGVVPVMLYLPDLAVSHGLTRTEASFLVSGYGIANTFGRLSSGALSNLPRVDSTVVHAIALFLISVDVALLLQCSTFSHFMAGSIFFGLCGGTFMSLRTLVVVDLLGVELLTVAFGIICVAQGTGYIVLPPICGILYASSGSFHSAFYLISGMTGIGGVVCSLLRPVQKWKKYRKAKQLEKQVL